MSEPVHKYNVPEEEPSMTDRNSTSEDSTAASKIGKAILWTSLGLAVVMGAIFAGLTLRARRFRNRTPYDNFSHAGDNLNSSAEYGMGI
jgi:hypothetical protein